MCLFLLWPLSKAIWEDSSFSPDFQLETLLGHFVCCYYNYLKMNEEEWKSCEELTGITILWLTFTSHLGKSYKVKRRVFLKCSLFLKTDWLIKKKKSCFLLHIVTEDIWLHKISKGHLSSCGIKSYCCCFFLMCYRIVSVLSCKLNSEFFESDSYKSIKHFH